MENALYKYLFYLFIFIYSSSGFLCQKQLVISITVNKTIPLSLFEISSAVVGLWYSLLMARFKYLGSGHYRSDLSFFSIMTRLLTQSVALSNESALSCRSRSRTALLSIPHTIRSLIRLFWSPPNSHVFGLLRRSTRKTLSGRLFCEHVLNLYLSHVTVFLGEQCSSNFPMSALIFFLFLYR